MSSLVDTMVHDEACGQGIGTERGQTSSKMDQSMSTGQYLPVTAQAIVIGQTLELEVARTRKQREMGLMYRSSLPENRGMLFPLLFPRNISLWMKNVFIPLDMVFLRKGRIVRTLTAQPCSTAPCPFYRSDGVVDQIIELRGGKVAELGLQKGDRIQVEYLSAQPLSLERLASGSAFRARIISLIENALGRQSY